MELRACEVTLELGYPTSYSAKRRILRPINAVFAREIGTAPLGESPLEWLLLTTRPALTFEEARAVVRGYTQRWRIEEFHKTWKSGACRIEESQLRAREHLIRWAVLAASVAVRIVRIAYLARSKPDDPATIEFSEHEIEAAILLAKAPAPRRGPTLKDMVSWIARLGGFVGGKSAGPPGPL